MGTGRTRRSCTRCQWRPQWPSLHRGGQGTKSFCVGVAEGGSARRPVTAAQPLCASGNAMRSGLHPPAHQESHNRIEDIFTPTCCSLTDVQAKAHVDLVARHAGVQIRPAVKAGRKSQSPGRRRSAKTRQPRRRQQARRLALRCKLAQQPAPKRRRRPAHRAENLLSLWLRLRAAWMTMKLASACSDIHT